MDPDTVRGLRRLRGLGLSDRPDPSPPAEVLTPAQAALLLQVNEATVLEMAETGHIPGRKLGGEWRFSRLALMAWLAGPASGGEG